MNNQTNFIRYFLLLLSLLTFSFLQAQPFNLEERIQPVELSWKDYIKEGSDNAKGRISLNELTQEQDTMYYFIKGLNMYAATYFSVNSAEPDADLKIHLCKENWKTFHRTGEVKGKSLWKADFKTEGDFGIMVVTNKKPTKYVLLVWTGEEMKVELPSVFKGGDEKVSSPAGKEGKSNNTLLIIGGALALGVIGFLLYKLRQKKST